MIVRSAPAVWRVWGGTTLFRGLMPSDQIVFEYRPVGWVWIACAVIALLAGGIGVFAITDGAPTMAILFVGAVALVFALFAALMFKTRNDSAIYYEDRVERFRAGAPLDSMLYADVQTVAWGIKPQSQSQFLEITGPGPNGEPRIQLNVVGDSATGPTELTSEKLIWLRDLLNEIVAARMLANARNEGAAKWFNEVYLTPEGIRVGGQVTPWTQAHIQTDDATGALSVHAGGQRKTVSMIHDNVVAGLIAANTLRENALEARFSP